MKKILMTVAAMAAMVGFAGQDDLLVTISSEKQLYYNNETLVNNEIVALVWTPAGSTFGGFLADGSVQGDSEVLARMVVKDGKFPTTTFQISAKRAEEKKYSQGAFALYLLDTRAASGTAQGVVVTSDNKQIVPVNYYAKIVGGEVSGTAVGTVGSIEPGADEEATVFARGKADLPFEPTALAPIIKSAKVEDGKFKVTIEQAVPYLAYGLTVGTTPVKTDMKPAGEVKSGTTEEIVLEYPIDPKQPTAFIQATAGRNQ